MPINIIEEFDLAKYAPLLSDQISDDVVNDIKYPWVGMKVIGVVSTDILEFIGGPVSTSAPYTNINQWMKSSRLIVGTGDPTGVEIGLVDTIYIDDATGDVYQHNEIGWNFLFDLSGSEILLGGADPSDASGNDKDVYIQGVDGTLYLKGDVFKKAAGLWGTPLFNIKGTDGAAGADGDTYRATSTTSIDLGGAVDPLNVILDASTYDYSAGQSVIVASRANPSVDFLTGTVLSYSGTTLQLGSISYNGTGTHTDWDVNLSGASGGDGADGVAGKGFQFNDTNLTLSQAHIGVVQAFGYDTINPYIASVTIDNRTTSEMSATAGIVGDMSGYVIIYDGIQWKSARWLGANGQTVVYKLGVASNGAKRVHQIQSFAIGSTTYQNDINKYLGATGLVTDINNAVDLRGEKGDPGDPGTGSFGLHVTYAYQEAIFNQDPNTVVPPNASNLNYDMRKLSFVSPSLIPLLGYGGFYNFGNFTNTEPTSQRFTFVFTFSWGRSTSGGAVRYARLSIDNRNWWLDVSFAVQRTTLSYSKILTPSQNFIPSLFVTCQDALPVGNPQTWLVPPRIPFQVISTPENI